MRKEGISAGEGILEFTAIGERLTADNLRRVLHKKNFIGDLLFMVRLQGSWTALRKTASIFGWPKVDAYTAQVLLDLGSQVTSWHPRTCWPGLCDCICVLVWHRSLSVYRPFRYNVTCLLGSSDKTTKTLLTSIMSP